MKSLDVAMCLLLASSATFFVGGAVGTISPMWNTKCSHFPEPALRPGDIVHCRLVKDRKAIILELEPNGLVTVTEQDYNNKLNVVKAEHTYLVFWERD